MFVCFCTYIVTHVYTCSFRLPDSHEKHIHVHVRDKQAKAKIYTQDSFLFFKEKTALGGIQTHDTPCSKT